jgi:hypothetical protein
VNHAKPEPTIEQRGGYEITRTPLAFRASKRHPWRSYEEGNPLYVRDDRLFYTLGADELVLFALSTGFTGISYETHCCECGAYVVGYVLIGHPIDAVSDVRVTCGSCTVRLTGSDIRQDALRQYMREYQRSLAPPEKRRKK